MASSPFSLYSLTWWAFINYSLTQKVVMDFLFIFVVLKSFFFCCWFMLHDILRAHFQWSTCDAGATWKFAIFDGCDERFIPSIKWNNVCNIKYDFKTLFFSSWRMNLMCTSHQIEWVNKEIIMLRPWCHGDGLYFTKYILVTIIISNFELFLMLMFLFLSSVYITINFVTYPYTLSTVRHYYL